MFGNRSSTTQYQINTSITSRDVRYTGIRKIPRYQKWRYCPWAC